MDKPRRNAIQTRARLLKAATDEFSANGLAGGRLDRIAREAKVSKPMLYSYFGDKDALFEAVLTHEVMEAASEDHFDADNLKQYAGRTYDFLVSRPRLWRLLTWYHLERGLDVFSLPAGQHLLSSKVERVIAAQATGQISADFSPLDVIRIVAALSQIWCTAEPAKDEEEHARRRSMIEMAVAKIFT